MYIAPPICGFAFIWSFSLDPKLLEGQAVTLMSPTAGSVPSLGMVDDTYETNDTVLNVLRSLLHRGLSRWGGSCEPCAFCLGLRRDPWLKARGGAGVSGVIQRLLRGNLNHHRCREQVCQPCFSL